MVAPTADPDEGANATAAPGRRLQEREAGLRDDPHAGKELLLAGRDHRRAGHVGLELVVEEVERGAQLEARAEREVTALVAAPDRDAVGRADGLRLAAEPPPPAEVGADGVVRGGRGRRGLGDHRRGGRRRRGLGLRQPTKRERPRRASGARLHDSDGRSRAPATRSDEVLSGLDGGSLGAAKGARRVPARGARSSFSIFMASTTTTVWPAVDALVGASPGSSRRARAWASAIVTGAASSPRAAPGAAIGARGASVTSAASTSGSAPGRRISTVILAPAPVDRRRPSARRPRRNEPDPTLDLPRPPRRPPRRRRRRAAPSSPSSSSTSRSFPPILTANAAPRRGQGWSRSLPPSSP